MQERAAQARKIAELEAKIESMQEQIDSNDEFISGLKTTHNKKNNKLYHDIAGRDKKIESLEESCRALSAKACGYKTAYETATQTNETLRSVLKRVRHNFYTKCVAPKEYERLKSKSKGELIKMYLKSRQEVLANKFVGKNITKALAPMGAKLNAIMNELPLFVHGVQSSKLIKEGISAGRENLLKAFKGIVGDILKVNELAASFDLDVKKEAKWQSTYTVWDSGPIERSVTQYYCSDHIGETKRSRYNNAYAATDDNYGPTGYI